MTVSSTARRHLGRRGGGGLPGDDAGLQHRAGRCPRLRAHDPDCGHALCLVHDLLPAHRGRLAGYCLVLARRRDLDTGRPGGESRPSFESGTAPRPALSTCAHPHPHMLTTPPLPDRRCTTSVGCLRPSPKRSSSRPGWPLQPRSSCSTASTAGRLTGSPLGSTA